MPEVDTVTADKYACAFATKECPGILRKHPLGEDYLCDAPNYCPPCSGIGRVRVLTGVTEPCPQLSDYPHFHFCPVCHGLDEFVRFRGLSSAMAYSGGLHIQSGWYLEWLEGEWWKVYNIMRGYGEPRVGEYIDSDGVTHTICVGWQNGGF